MDFVCQEKEELPLAFTNSGRVTEKTV